METCVRRISQKTGGGYGDGLVGTKEVGDSPSDELVVVSWYEEVEASLVPATDSPTDYAEEEEDEEEEDAVGMPNRRSKREAARVESGSGETKTKRKVDGKTKAPKVTNKKENKKEKKGI